MTWHQYVTTAFYKGNRLLNNYCQGYNTLQVLEGAESSDKNSMCGHVHEAEEYQFITKFKVQFALSSAA